MSKFQGLKINPLHMPSKFQEGLWADYVYVEDGTDTEGNWHGRCPLHGGEDGTPSALFNFQSGVLVCLGEPCCHGAKKAISFTNVLTQMRSST
jgi:hypothetical protein